MVGEQVFHVRGDPLETVRASKYLGRHLSKHNDDWPAVQANIRKARSELALVRKMLAETTHHRQFLGISTWPSSSRYCCMGRKGS